MAENQANLAQEVVTNAEKVIELLNNTDLQQKFAFVKANAEIACKSVNPTLPTAVNTAIFQIGTSDITDSNSKDSIVNNLNTIIQYLKTNATV